MQFTTVRIKEKDYDIYLKSEKLDHTATRKWKTLVPRVMKKKKWISQLFGSVEKTICSYLF